MPAVRTFHFSTAILFLLFVSTHPLWAAGTDILSAREQLKKANALCNSKPADAIRICHQLLLLANQNGMDSVIAETTMTLGMAHYFLGEYDSTLSRYLQARNQFEKLHLVHREAALLNELGIFYMKQNHSGEAASVLQQAFHIADSLHLYNHKATALNNLGLLNQQWKQPDKALQQFTEAARIYQQKGDSTGYSYSLDYASVVLAEKGKIPEAIALQQKALQLRTGLGDRNAQALSLINLAEMELKRQQATRAIQYLDQCIILSKAIQFNDLLAYCYKTKSVALAQQNKHKEALDYMNRYNDLNAQLYTEKSSRQINELQTRYESEKKNRQIELLKKENQLKNTQQQRLLLLILAVLISLTAVWLIRIQKLKQKKAKELATRELREQEERNKAVIAAEERERIRIARDLHDGVAQTMAAARLQLEAFMLKNQATALSLQNAFTLIDDAAREVRSVSHSMIPNALLKSGLLAAVREFVQRIGHDQLHVHLQVSGLDRRLPQEQEAVIFRILQELVNNIIRHAAASEITIQLNRDEAQFSLMVDDNGRGFDPATLSSVQGIGFRNIRSRVDFLKGELHIDSMPGRGTTVLVEIPATPTIT
ncbi:MAG TPA: tetratricopeptide repeat protein [Chitinophagaceae bacterium]|nr:tetratricopeptide repeat protein [Chitinophagaceae bacterium]HNF70765.1 tetratricopeptide repeat protein [Chitinophagaceae bacterium]